MTNAAALHRGQLRIARHPRSYEREDTIFEPIHYLPLIEQKIGALDQAAPLAGWDLPPAFQTLRRLMEARSTPCSLNSAAASSGIVLSGVASISAFRNLETASSLLIRGRPCGAVATDPVRFLRCIILTALAAEIRNRRAASWQENPPSTKETTRSRMSNDSDLPMIHLQI